MKNFRFALCIVVCILLIVFSSNAASYARTGYDVFINSIFPSLLPFFVFTTLLRGSSFFEKSKSAFFVLAIISGAPSAARLLKDVDLPSKKKTQLCAALNTISPMFTISVLATKELSSTSLALPILIAQSISIVIMLIPFYKTKISFSKQGRLSFAEAVSSSMNSMLSLCGTVVVFLVLIGIVSEFIPHKNNIAVLFISGIAEVSSGCLGLGGLGVETRILSSLGAFFVTFGGICVLMQSKTFFRIDSLRYIGFKFIQSTITAILAYILTPLFYFEAKDVFNPVSQERLAENATSMGTVLTVSMLVIFAIILLGIAYRSITNPRKR